ncbi:hypothetical protein ULMA_18100 [Patiriisocius marinus]|uniref:Glycosyl transferase family 1 domain-containing protein n=1 Tax=Patiriisocius marinus TaxID=1397112 RepID=A0A5J4IYY0_9FLAO|nr:glycosyltransferase family 4 protein [Patiriisocius marinus]GER59702.1 hypothetical protein ULMA_18100 [Patiriisocius marinus]
MKDFEELNIAIFSPNKNPYSETFIQAHKLLLKGRVHYFYGKGDNIKNEDDKYKRNYLIFLLFKLYGKITNKGYSYARDRVLSNSMRKLKVDAILIEYGTHAHHLRNFLKNIKIPITVHFHGSDATVNKIIEFSNNYEDVFGLSNKVIAVSKDMEKKLLNIGCPKNKLIYNVYGPRIEFEEINPKFSKKRFIAIGRFTNKKAPYYLILSFMKVLDVHEDAELHIAGNGVLFNTCTNLINYFGLQHSIKLIGVITPEQYQEYLSTSRAFVQHSITADNGDMEGTPLAVLEASVSGIPVISTFHAGITDVIINKKTGLLSKEHDVDLMADNMIKVLSDLDYAKEMGAAGKNHIKNNFSMERHITSLQEIIKSTI